MGKNSAVLEPPALPTAASVLRNLTYSNGTSLTDGLTVRMACTFLDACATAMDGLRAFVLRTNKSFAGDWSFTHASKLTSFCAHYATAAGEVIDDETQLALVADYIDFLVQDDTGASSDFIDWLFMTCGLERPEDFVVASVSHGVTPVPEAPKTRKRKSKTADAAATPHPDQADLPFDANGATPAPEPAAKKTRARKDLNALPDWSGKKIKYRAGKAWVVGVVDKDGGKTALLSFTDEAGEPWSNVDRTLCKVIKPRGKAADDDDADDDLLPAAPADPLANLILVVPDKAEEKYTKFFANQAKLLKSVAPGAVAAAFDVVDGGYRVCVEVTNGTPGSNGVYTDIYVMPYDPAQPDKSFSPSFEHTPSVTLAGTYKVMLGDVERTLEIITYTNASSAQPELT